VNLEARGVDEQSIRSILGTREGREEIFPNAPLRPSDEAIVERLLRPINLSRTIRPSTTVLQCMHDPAQNAAIINPLDTARIVRQKRFDPRPLRIRKPKEIRHH
jgi:hypothetical protein